MRSSALVLPRRLAGWQDTRTLVRVRNGAAYYIVVAIVSVFFFGPFLWTVISSLKDASEITTFPPTFLPKVLHFENYVYAWTKVPFVNFYINSLIVAGLAVTGQTASATLVAYGFARFRFPLRNVLFMLVLATLMVPWEVTIVPSFLLFKFLGWLDTLTPLIAPHWFGGGPFFIFLMRQFLMTIPRDFDEAAKIDGANSLQILWHVLVPLCRPAITAVAIFSFLFHWNAFIEPLIFLNTPEKFTISLGMRYFQTIPMEAGEPKDHLLMAGTIIMVAPCVVLFFLAQRYFVRGIVLSGLKG
jgi:multiple sugar transport system permease protein